MEDLERSLNEYLNQLNKSDHAINFSTLPALSQISHILICLLAVHTRTPLLLSQENEKRVFEIINTPEKNDNGKKYLQNHIELGCVQIINVDELIVEMSGIPSLFALKDTHGIYAHLQKSIIWTNSLIIFHHTTVSSTRMYSNVSVPDSLKDLKSLLQEGTVISLSQYFSGSIEPKEPGSFLFHSNIGDIQVGIPPETIKTSLKRKQTVPQIYVLPPNFCGSGGVSYGEMEFPIYFNFFINKAFLDRTKRLIVIGHQQHLDRIRDIFKESFFGPNLDEIFIDEEITPNKKAQGYHIDYKAERSTLAQLAKDGSELPMSDFVEFIPLSQKGHVTLTRPKANSSDLHLDISINGGLLCFSEDGVLKGSLDLTAPLPRQQPENFLSYFPPVTGPTPSFQPPIFGITFLGTSHGFDPNGATTGFVIWVNGRGILVDPPLGSTEYLHSRGVPFRDLTSVILTHCHSDHDAGILQAILNGEKVRLYTTKTIHQSYLRKARAITGIQDIETYYQAVNVPIGNLLKIYGADFEFDYSYHTIPACRFKVTFKGKSISYSADTQYDPKVYQDLLNKGVINYAREVALRMFVFDADMIIHESGVPPIHTEPANLNDLPISIKEKMHIVHCHQIPRTVTKNVNGKNVVIPVEGLRIPKSGIENTISLPIRQVDIGRSIELRRFALFCENLFLQKLSPSIVYRLYCLAEELNVKAGDVVVREGQKADRFYMIDSGYLEVWQGSGDIINSKVDGGSFIRVIQTGDSFGEKALYKDGNKAIRSATVIAIVDCKLLYIDSSVLPPSLCDDLDSDLNKVSRYSSFISSVLSCTFPFSACNLSKDQMDVIASSIDREVSVKKNETVINEGEIGASLFIILSGSVVLRKNGKDLRYLGPGQCFGELALLINTPRAASVIASEDSILLELEKTTFLKLMEKFQNLRFSTISYLNKGWMK